jgi:hypothetical protein
MNVPNLMGQRKFNVTNVNEYNVLMNLLNFEWTTYRGGWNRSRPKWMKFLRQIILFFLFFIAYLSPVQMYEHEWIWCWVMGFQFAFFLPAQTECPLTRCSEYQSARPVGLVERTGPYGGPNQEAQRIKHKDETIWSDRGNIDLCALMVRIQINMYHNIVRIVCNASNAMQMHECNITWMKM